MFKSLHSLQLGRLLVVVAVRCMRILDIFSVQDITQPAAEGRLLLLVVVGVRHMPSVWIPFLTEAQL